MLSVRDIKIALGSFSVRDVSFDVEDGGYFVLLGASGIGKTVLLETIAGILPPDGGKIVLDGRDITREKIQKRGLGLVYQDQALFPHMTVGKNIAYGLHCRKMSRPQIRDRATRLAADVGTTHLLDRMPGTLSAGEAQRVALARVLAAEPRCLLLDEPISSLDVEARSGMRTLLRKLHRQGQTMLHVTHDYEEAVSLASRVGIMERGTVAEVGTPEEVFRHPKSEFVARFVGIRNFLKGRLRRPAGAPGGPAEFVTDGPILTILTDAEAGPGFLTLRSEDITLSDARPVTSARNTFKGTIVDIAAARLGVEVVVDIGVEVSALVTETSVEEFGLECGSKVWVSFKATAGRFLEA